jgi:signal recognition particle subunit SRP54
MDPAEIAEWGVKQAETDGCDVIIVDTAGRLHVDQALMDELVRIKKGIKPHNVLLVLDSMTGQEAVSVAEQFDSAVSFDGVVLTKLDGDARGGAALSVKTVTGKPIKYVSLGEKLDSLELFHPDRMASRILGMGDMLTLIEKAEQAFDEDEAADLERKMRKAQFTFEDFLKQMRAIKRMGSFSSILSMLPGIPKELKNIDIDESQLSRIEAMILSMTPAERNNPDLLDAGRRRRIAAGSGMDVTAVNQMVKSFVEMRKMMKQVMGGKMPAGMAEMMGGMDPNAMGGLQGGMPDLQSLSGPDRDARS